MRLKTFHARTIAEAMQMVRDTLGEDAVIVATREDRGGGVNVTAAIEPAFELGRGGAAAADDWLQYDGEDEESAVAEELTDVMLRHGVPEDVMDHILSCATVIGLEEPGIALIAAVEHLFYYRPLPTKPCKKAVMMVGPPGSGKTLAAAKMAARGVMNGLKIGVVTTDAARAGGIEQLQAFTRLLEIDLKPVKKAEDLPFALENLGGCDQIVIDSAGINPFDKEDAKALARLIGSAAIEPVLVMPAGTDAEEAGDMARIFSAIGVHGFLPTRIDIARRLGGVLAAAQRGGLYFTDASNTPKVAEGLMPLDPKILARLLMPAAYRREQPEKINPQRMTTGTGARTRQ